MQEEQTQPGRVPAYSWYVLGVLVLVYVMNFVDRQIMSILAEDIKKDLGITVIMVEHDMKLVSAVSDRVMALNYGRVLAMGAPTDVQQNPDVVRAYIGGEA